MITESEQKVIQAIRSYWIKHNYSPSSRDLMKLVGYKSSNTIHTKLHSLKDKGLINFVDYEPRTITVVADRLNYIVGD